MLPNTEPTPTSSVGLSRRDFLRAGSLGAGAVGLALADLGAATGGGDVNCILLCLVGGPSHLETFDLKPGAPSQVRGPFRPIHTNVPGVEICEHLPLLAGMAQHYAIVRSVHHDAAPIHETGQQLLQTGHLCRGEHDHPHVGAVVSHKLGARAAGAAPFVILPGPIGNTGVSVGHGQGAGHLGKQHEPVYTTARDLDAEKPALRDRYGRNGFGQACLAARRLVEQGTRVVTVNMFDTVFDRITWDCHADGGALGSTLDDYATTLCPTFDRACSALLADLHERGMLQKTLVVALGEFGRTPYLNPRGGRDHWPGVWSVLFAGGGVQGGQVIGSSDRLGGEPRDRPTQAASVAATVYRGLGIDPGAWVEAAPITELWS